MLIFGMWREWFINTDYFVARKVLFGDAFITTRSGVVSYRYYGRDGHYMLFSPPDPKLTQQQMQVHSDAALRAIYPDCILCNSPDEEEKYQLLA